MLFWKTLQSIVLLCAFGGLMFLPVNAYADNHLVPKAEIVEPPAKELSGDQDNFSLSGKEIGELLFERDGAIRFRVIGAVSSLTKSVCKSTASDPWFKIDRCAVDDQNCLDGVKRMGAALLAAYLSTGKISFIHTQCRVKSVGFDR